MNGSEFNWSDFFHMGGYAVYVWASYGLALLMVVANIASPIFERKRVIARIKRAIKRETLREKTTQ